MEGKYLKIVNAICDNPIQHFTSGKKSKFILKSGLRADAHSQCPSSIQYKIVHEILER